MTNQIVKWLKNNASTILTCIGAGGMVATVALTIKAAPKAKWKLAQAKVNKENATGNDKLTVIETLQVCGMDYIPTTIVGICTLGCFFGANILNRKQQAALTSAYAALSSTYQSYRDKVCDIFGQGADEMVQKAVEEEKAKDDDYPPWDIPQTFYLEGYGKFFERTMDEVKSAEYSINRMFILNGSATFNDFLKMLNLDPVADGDGNGWDIHLGETLYGYRWIDFNHRHYSTEEGLMVCAIDMPFEPHAMNEDLF